MYHIYKISHKYYKLNVHHLPKLIQQQPRQNIHPHHNCMKKGHADSREPAKPRPN
jgi:hypothetical protein